MFLLMIAGVGAIVAGAAAIWFGIPVKEFSFGNTMILAGTGAICSGLILMAAGLILRELKLIRRRLQSVDLDLLAREPDGPLLPAGSIVGRGPRSEDGRFERPRVSQDGSRGGASPLEASGSRHGGAIDPERGSDIHEGASVGRAAPNFPPPPPVKARRNLLFSSTLRKERQQGRSPGSVAESITATEAFQDRGSSQPGSGAQPSPHPSFSNAWPRDERTLHSDALTSRHDASPPTSSHADRDPASASAEPLPSETMVKSGVVDGMAYKLYSDGSIEAQMPEGMIRFASIEELRAHLDRAT